MAFDDPNNTLPTPANYASPTQLQSMYDYSKALMDPANMQTPVHHWLQGVSNIAQAVTGGMVGRQADVLQQKIAAARAAVYNDPDITGIPATPKTPGTAPATGATPSYADTGMKLESNNDPNAVAGSHKGLSQGNAAWDQQYGLNDSNRGDRTANAAAWNKEAATNTPTLAAATHAQPSEAQLYVAHVAGPGGAVAHYTNPQGVAWENMAGTKEGRDIASGVKDYPPGSGQTGPAAAAKWAQASVWGNLPDSIKAKVPDVNHVTSQDFTNIHEGRYHTAQMAGQGPQGAAPGAAPAAGQPPQINIQQETNRIAAKLAATGIPGNEALAQAKELVASRLPTYSLTPQGQVMTQYPGQPPTMGGDTLPGHPGEALTMFGMPMYRRIEGGKPVIRDMGGNLVPIAGQPPGTPPGAAAPAAVPSGPSGASPQPTATAAKPGGPLGVAPPKAETQPEVTGREGLPPLPMGGNLDDYRTYDTNMKAFGEGQTAFAKTANEGYAKRGNDLINSYTSQINPASQMLEQLGGVNATLALPGAEKMWTGDTMGPMGLKLGQLYEGVTSAMGNPQKFEGVLPAQMLQKFATFVGQQAAKQGSGTATEMAQFLESAAPSLHETKDAIKMVTDVISQQQQRNLALGNLGMRVPPTQQGYQAFTKAIDQYDKEHPLTLHYQGKEYNSASEAIDAIKKTAGLDNAIGTGLNAGKPMTLEAADPQKLQIAAQRLRENPALKDDFEKMFGPGSAAKVLGQ